MGFLDPYGDGKVNSFAVQPKRTMTQPMQVRQPAKIRPTNNNATAQLNAPNQTQGTANYGTTAGNYSYSGTSSAPVYRGLMDGDYEKLQTALAVPGAQKIENAYNQGSQTLNNTMSGRGLYGSSIMAQQQIQGLERERMNADAANSANAAATRYQMQQADLGKAADVGMTGWKGLLDAGTARAGFASQERIGANNNLTQRYGIDTTAGTAMAGLLSAERQNAADNLTKTYGIDVGKAMQLASNLSNEQIAAMNSATQRYGMDTQASTQLATNALNNQTQTYGIDKQFAASNAALIAQMKAAEAAGDSSTFNALMGLAGISIAQWPNIKAAAASLSSGISGLLSDTPNAADYSGYVEPDAFDPYSGYQY